MTPLPYFLRAYSHVAPHPAPKAAAPYTAPGKSFGAPVTKYVPTARMVTAANAETVCKRICMPGEYNG